MKQLITVILILSSCWALAGEGELYIPAYNELVRMLNDRYVVVWQSSSGLPLKDLRSDDPTLNSVGQGDLDVLRTRVHLLMRDHFIANDAIDHSGTTVALAFRRSAALIMKGIGKDGQFTAVPAEYTVNGQAYYSNVVGGEVPLMWIHFTELFETLKRLTHTRQPGWWTANGEPNSRSGYCLDLHREFEDSKQHAMDLWNATAPFSKNGGVGAFSMGAFTESQGLWSKGYSSTLLAGYGYMAIEGLAAREHNVTFYVYADATDEWDTHGVDISRQTWLPFCQSESENGATAMSTRLGNTDLPIPWCEEPPPVVPASRRRGYYIAMSQAVLEWPDLYIGKLENPSDHDTASDGICDTGCGGCFSGNCLPGLDPEFDEKFRDGHIQFPLGISSGLINGNIRVKAYVSEYIIEGVPLQVFSLDTHVTSYEDNDGQWSFALVTRPSGAQVLFALVGEGKNAPIGVGHGYTLAKRDGGYELEFSDKAKTVHRFSAGGALLEVRRTVENHEITAYGTPSIWGDLLVDRTAAGIVHSVSTMRMNAICTTSDDLVVGVNYLGLEGQSLRKIGLAPGSRILREWDAQGSLTDETRIYTGPNAQEIWRDVTTNGTLSVAQKTIRTLEPESAAGTRTILHTDILHPDSAQEQRSQTATVIRSYPWGDEVVERTGGYGSSIPQTTRYHYYKNPADTNSYGRVSLVEYPDGSWTRYDAYGPGGRSVRVVTPFKDSPPNASATQCRELRYVYIGDPELVSLAFPAEDVEQGNDHRPRLIVESLLGHEVARTYHAYLPEAHVTRRCLDDGALYTSENALVSSRSVHTEGLFAGRLSRVEHADGTLSTYTYDYDATAQQLTTTLRQGAQAGGVVINGTETISVVGVDNKTVSSRTLDISSGLTLAHTVYERDAFGRTLSVSNLVNDTSTHSVYGCCGVEESVDGDGVTTAYIYGNLGRMDQSVRLGITSSYRYDVRGNTIERTVSAGTNEQRTSSQFDAAGRPIAEIDELGHITRFEYDVTPEGGQRLTTIFPDGSTSVEESYRDGQLRVVSGTAAHPQAFDFGADARGSYEITYRGPDTSAAEWIKTWTDRLGRIDVTEYPDGYAITNRYDIKGRDVGRDDGVTATLTDYSDDGSLLRSAIDMNRNGVIDLAGPDRVVDTQTRTTQHEGHTVRESSTRVYMEEGSDVATLSGRSLVAVDGSNSWQVAFGQTKHVMTVLNPAAGTRTVTAVQPDGSSIVSHFDRGRMLSTTRFDSLGGTVSSQSFTYDPFSRVATRSEQVANGETRIISTLYNAGGAVTSMTATAGALQQRTSHLYDSMGRQVQTTLPDDGIVTYEYNPRGELAAQYGARVYPTRYTYTDQGQMATLSTFRNGFDGPADITSWIYDHQRGWLSAKLDAVGEGDEYAYTSNGRLERKTLARGVTVDYAYDIAGALTNVLYSDGTPSLQYRHDRLGRPVEVVDALGTRTNTYEELGRLVQATLPQLPGAALHYQYDALARLTNTVLSINGAPVHNTAYHFDAAGRVDSVTGPGVLAGYAYGADGLTVTNLVLGPDGVVNTTKEYDGLNRLTRIAHQTSVGDTRFHAYTYNDADQRISATTEDGSVWQYRYDDLGQLISGKKYFADGTPRAGAQHEYQYDRIGNRKSVRNGIGASATESNYTANELNQYTQRTVPGEVMVTGTADPTATVTVQNTLGPTNNTARHGGFFSHRLTIDNTTAIAHTTSIVINAYAKEVEDGVTNHIMETATRSATLPKTPEHFAHDLDGNLTSDGLWSYTWNGENRLTTISNSDALITFAYDYMGRRTCRTVCAPYDLDSPTSDSRYIYDGWNLIYEGDHAATHTRTNLYTWGLDISGTPQSAGGIGGLLSMTSVASGVSPDPQTLFCCYDGNGNLTTLYDSTTATQTAHYTYSPFGHLTQSTGPMAPHNPFRFSTKYQDPDTRLVYYGYRHYSPEQGRWLNRDPIGEMGGIDLYGLLRNSPIGYIDPWGLALYAFDGTGTRKETWTNVSILYRSYQGEAFYADGVGSAWYSKLPGGITGLGGRARLNEMYRNLVATYKAGDRSIDIIGFSRGAALAREFANMIHERGIIETTYHREKTSGPHGRSRNRSVETVIDCDPAIRFVGLFDTVGSFGVPGNHLNIGIRMGLPPNVQSVAQAIAKDEHRAAFPLTPLNEALPGQRFSQHIFRGDHSDIGGGHRDNQNLLALAPLFYIHERGHSAGVPFGPLNLAMEDGQIFLEVGGKRRPWAYQWNLNPHDLTEKWYYADGGPRNSLPPIN
ncbi:MAG: DUF2235 domain-containing protein [Lentisphaerae bacterium]|nr:DUF2235 domain-containing protein [Lentisphaerota bacterium]